MESFKIKVKDYSSHKYKANINIYGVYTVHFLLLCFGFYAINDLLYFACLLGLFVCLILFLINCYKFLSLKLINKEYFYEVYPNEEKETRSVLNQINDNSLEIKKYKVKIALLTIFFSISICCLFFGYGHFYYNLLLFIFGLFSGTICIVQINFHVRMIILHKENIAFLKGQINQPLT